MFKREDASHTSFCLGEEVGILQGAHGPWRMAALIWTAQWAQSFPLLVLRLSPHTRVAGCAVHGRFFRDGADGQ